ncbi:MAG TPA: hypothetical protein VGW38_15690, partial [Chloroflexota bacterium]|nr:hypothetical protein [Chloroflexota bacterium]
MYDRHRQYVWHDRVRWSVPLIPENQLVDAAEKVADTPAVKKGGRPMSNPLFAPIPLQSRFNATRHPEPGMWHPAMEATLRELPGGNQRFWGIPFALAPDDRDRAAPAWLLLGDDSWTGAATALGVPAGNGTPSPSYLVFLHACGLPSTIHNPQSTIQNEHIPDSVLRPGQHVASYVLIYFDGTEHRHPIRWRFEINGGTPMWGQRAFAARPHIMDAPLDFRGPYPANAWGRYQTSVQQGSGNYWLYALPNPYPEKSLQVVRLETAGGAAVAVGGLTLFYGQDHPLRHQQLQSFRLTLPAPTTDESEQEPDKPAGAETHAGRLLIPDVSIDLGVIARKYAIPAFDPDAWLGGEGISQPLPLSVPREAVNELILDITASADATLRVGEHVLPLRDVYETGQVTSAGGAARIEVLTPHRTWVHITVEDAVTGKPAPSRIHFRAPDGRYLPPYGYRHEVNDNWFEDYGADVKLHGTQYAYVDGTFQMDIPVGDVYVEVFKGFEHQPLRQKLTIEPGQRSLTLRAERPLNWRHRGWVTADTHVHFISPQTAWLQGQAEGLNLINLLASQWGDLYTNVGDISGGLSGVSRDETLVYVGTENRQHLLGHMSLLGAKGEPVFPMTTSGPSESYIGDPTWNTLAE